MLWCHNAQMLPTFKPEELQRKCVVHDLSNHAEDVMIHGRLISVVVRSGNENVMALCVLPKRVDTVDAIMDNFRLVCRLPTKERNDLLVHMGNCSRKEACPNDVCRRMFTVARHKMECAQPKCVLCTMIVREEKGT